MNAMRLIPTTTWRALEPGHAVVEAEKQDLPLFQSHNQVRTAGRGDGGSFPSIRNTCSPERLIQAKAWRQQPCRGSFFIRMHRGDGHGHGHAADQEKRCIDGAGYDIQLMCGDMKIRAVFGR